MGESLRWALEGSKTFIFHGVILVCSGNCDLGAEASRAAIRFRNEIGTFTPLMMIRAAFVLAATPTPPTLTLPAPKKRAA